GRRSATGRTAPAASGSAEPDTSAAGLAQRPVRAVRRRPVLPRSSTGRRVCRAGSVHGPATGRQAEWRTGVATGAPCRSTRRTGRAVLPRPAAGPTGDSCRSVLGRGGVDHLEDGLDHIADGAHGLEFL